MAVRILASAVLGAALLSGDIVLLVLFLNPEISAWGEARTWLLFLPYLLGGTAVFLVLSLLGATFRFWPAALRPRVEGLPWFTSLSFLALVATASLYWLNLSTYRYSIPLESVRALAESAVVITLTAFVLLGVMADAFFFPSRGRGASTALVVLCYAAGFILPLALRPELRRPARPVPLVTEAVAPVRRIVLLGIDGLGPDLIQRSSAHGRLPALSRLIRLGGSGPLASLRPAQGPPVWTTVFTGRFPRDHGVKGFTTYSLRGSPSTFEILPRGILVSLLERTGLVTSRPVTASSRKRRAVWEVLNAFGVQTGVVRFWGTQPPELLKGFMLSNYFHLLRHEKERGPETLYPRDLWTEVNARGVEPSELDPELLAQFVDPSVPLEGDTVPWRRELLERALAPDFTYERAGEVLRAAYSPPFFATYFYGLDVVGHTFLRFSRPEAFGDVTPAQQRRYGHVVERYAALLDQWVGEAARRLGPGDILMVVSGYGIEPVPLWRRFLSGIVGAATGSGTHESAPDGFIAVVGDGVKAGTLVRRASLLDVAPTLLYFMGLPVARDMEGRVLTEIVSDDFARAHPVSFIPSYESLAVTPTAGPQDSTLPPLPDDPS